MFFFCTTDDDKMWSSDFEPNKFPIKREVLDEPPTTADEFVDLDQHSDFSFPPVVKVRTGIPFLSLSNMLHLFTPLIMLFCLALISSYYKWCLFFTYNIGNILTSVVSKT